MSGRRPQSLRLDQILYVCVEAWVWRLGIAALNPIPQPLQWHFTQTEIGLPELTALRFVITLISEILVQRGLNLSLENHAHSLPNENKIQFKGLYCLLK